MRWLYHLIASDDPRCSAASLDEYAPGSLAHEGFVHCSYRDAVRESARLYFAGTTPSVLRIDPRRLDVRVDDASTPRGPMPHVHGPVPADAIREVLALDAIDDAPDAVTGTRFVVLAFAGMTLLDLVGVCDPLSRVTTMGIDVGATLMVGSIDDMAPFVGWDARFHVGTRRPLLDAADVLVFVGGPDSRALAASPDVIAYVRSYPTNRLVASVCTGALFLGEAGRLDGKRATTHASAIEKLATFGARASSERVVFAGNVITAGGVTCGIDLGLALVDRLYGAEARRTIASRMEWPID